MKLVEILARDLPERGGWPEEMSYFVQDGDGEIKPGKDSGAVQRVDQVWLRGENIRPALAFMAEKAEDWESAIVTREFYEKFISVQSELMWDGKGIPPVDFTCEFSHMRDVWTTGTIKYKSLHTVVIETDEEFAGVMEPCFSPNELEFREKKTEDQAKEKAIEEIKKCLMRYQVIDVEASAEFLYKALAESKIPGVRLEDKS